MPKRFTDTDKWKKPFIRGLQGAYKLLWFYILDDCDHAGIWQVDFEVARIRTGEQIDKQSAINAFGDRIEIFAEGSKWFLRDFIEFQYGQLSDKNRMHLSVINILTKNNIGAYKGLISPQGQGQGQGQGNGSIKGQGETLAQETRNFIWFQKQIDEIWTDQLSTEKKKNLHRAIENAWTFLSTDDHRLKIIDSSGCKKLVSNAFEFLKTDKSNGKTIRNTNSAAILDENIKYSDKF